MLKFVLVVQERNHIGLAIRAFFRLEVHWFAIGISWYEALVGDRPQCHSCLLSCFRFRSHAKCVTSGAMKNNERYTVFESKNLFIAEEYRKLVGLPVLYDEEAERMTEILELANLDENLNRLIEEIETRGYLESRWNKRLGHLLKLVSTDDSKSKFKI